MDDTKVGGLSKDSQECSGIAQPFCNPQDCKRLRQIWELTQNPAALCQDCKKMVQSTIPAEHSAKWLRIAVEFRNGPAIHTILCNAFNQPAILSRLAILLQFKLIVPGILGSCANCELTQKWLGSDARRAVFLRLVCNPRNFYAMLSINLQSFIDSQSWCNSN